MIIAYIRMIGNNVAGDAVIKICLFINGANVVWLKFYGKWCGNVSKINNRTPI